MSFDRLLTATPYSCKVWDAFNGRGLATLEGKHRYVSTCLGWQSKVIHSALSRMLMFTQVLARGSNQGHIDLWHLAGYQRSRGHDVSPFCSTKVDCAL